MECGEFDKRNEEYSRNFSKEDYFSKLIYGPGWDNTESPVRGDDVIIFDVGAHKGESAKFFTRVFPNSFIHSFEPNPTNSEQIEKIKLPKVIVHSKALSDFDGTAQFNVQNISHLSSLHKVNKNGKSSLGYASKEIHTCINVDVCRGDTFIKSNAIRYIDLLKVDVQANEVNTLKGFGSCIEKVSNVMVEVSLYDFYESRSSIFEIEKILRNFTLYDIYEISKNPKTLGTDWVTLVYINNQIDEDR